MNSQLLCTTSKGAWSGYVWCIIGYLARPLPQIADTSRDPAIRAAMPCGAPDSREGVSLSLKQSRTDPARRAGGGDHCAAAAKCATKHTLLAPFAFACSPSAVVPPGSSRSGAAGPAASRRSPLLKPRTAAAALAFSTGGWPGWSAPAASAGSAGTSARNASHPWTSPRSACSAAR